MTGAWVSCAILADSLLSPIQTKEILTTRWPMSSSRRLDPMNEPPGPQPEPSNRTPVRRDQKARGWALPAEGVSWLVGSPSCRD